MCKITSQESETNSEYKVYKLNTYVNSDKNPFGLTLKGRTKEYILAHETFQHLIVKRKKYFVGKGFFKVVDPNQRPAMVDAILEVSEDGIEKGNVEIKVYNPSNNKKKGATIELRKMSGHD